MNTAETILKMQEAYVSRVLLERAKTNLVYDSYAQKRNIPANITDSIKFRKYGNLTPETTPLEDGITPLGSNLSTTDIVVTAEQYGNFTIITDRLKATEISPLLGETADILGQQEGETIDLLAREEVVSTTNVIYADKTSPRANDSRDDIVAEDKLSLSEVLRAVKSLKNAKAMKVTKRVSANAGTLTEPVNTCFIGIIHTDVAVDLLENKATSGFVPVEQYADKGDVMPFEVGKIGEVRFVETQSGKIFEGEGAGEIDVYGTVIFGQHAYGSTMINGLSSETIVKALGSAGTADPLNQRMSMGWKTTYACKVLQPAWLVRMEHAG